MPKRLSRRHKKGGFLGLWGNDSSSQDPNKKSTWSSWFGTTPTSTTTTPTYSSTTTTTTPTYSSTTTTPTYSSTSSQMNYGGKKRSKTRRGGYSANTPTTGIASTGAPFSGATAKPQHWVGGKTKKRHHKRHRHSKSRRH
jgi:hypothetical protein